MADLVSLSISKLSWNGIMLCEMLVDLFFLVYVKKFRRRWGLIKAFDDQWQPCKSISVSSVGRGLHLRRNMCVRASSSPAESSPAQIAPLQFESPIGQFLSQILVSHPHLLPAAVDQQLLQLQSDRDAEKQKEEPSTSGTDLVLYRSVFCFIFLPRFCQPK